MIKDKEKKKNTIISSLGTVTRYIYSLLSWKNISRKATLRNFLFPLLRKLPYNQVNGKVSWPLLSSPGVRQSPKEQLEGALRDRVKWKVFMEKKGAQGCSRAREDWSIFRAGHLLGEDNAKLPYYAGGPFLLWGRGMERAPATGWPRGFWPENSRLVGYDYVSGRGRHSNSVRFVPLFRAKQQTVVYVLCLFCHIPIVPLYFASGFEPHDFTKTSLPKISKDLCY